VIWCQREVDAIAAALGLRPAWAWGDEELVGVAQRINLEAK
jgi:hypothetical protein